MRASRLMQVTFSDHIIIAGDRYFSFKEEWGRWRVRKVQEEQAGKEARGNPREQKELENKKEQKAQEKQEKRNYENRSRILIRSNMA